MEKPLSTGIYPEKIAKVFLSMVEEYLMRLTPEPLYLSNLRMVRKYGGPGAQVTKLMSELRRQTELMNNTKAVVNNTEDFPSRIHRGSATEMRKLLDII